MLEMSATEKIAITPTEMITLRKNLRFKFLPIASYKILMVTVTLIVMLKDLILPLRSVNSQSV
jgi:hypothetical protein